MSIVKILNNKLYPDNATFYFSLISLIENSNSEFIKSGEFVGIVKNYIDKTQTRKKCHFLFSPYLTD